VAGVHVVAKNVECPEAQALLQALGVDFMQGYAAGAPAPLDTVEARMAELRIIDPQFGEQALADAEPRFAATG
jgi:EAL domain-containing protein (putative c-di-GMP-specific phosphodiesterase class I)